MKTDLLLASASPRRRELIARLRRDVIAVSTDADETIPEGVPAVGVPEILALRKAAAARSLPQSAGRTIIAADTVVILDGEIFGKPEDEHDARTMLKRLSGRTHRVVTGLCIISASGEQVTLSEVTEVTFFELSEREIEAYIATGEPMDKAGAYGIQTDGCMFVEGINGDFFNVVGLPVARLNRALDRLGI